MEIAFGHKTSTVYENEANSSHVFLENINPWKRWTMVDAKMSGDVD